MGNHKFKFSDMIPIVCFNNKANKKKKKPFDSLLHSSSFYYSPRNSFSIRREKRKTVYKPSPKAFTTNWSHSKSKIISHHNQDSSDHSVLALERSSDSFVIRFYDSIPPVSSRCSNFIISSSAEDIVIDIKDDAFTKIQLEEIEGLKDSVSNKMEKPAKIQLEEIKGLKDSVSNKMEKPFPAASNQANGLRKTHLSIKVTKDDYRKIQKKHQKPGIKLVNPRRIQVSTRKNVSNSKSKGVFNSFAMIKRSVDPKRDFKESMLEMIVENNITSSKDLQDLLACYLSLNPTEYHNVIIKVFEQIWFQLSKIRS